MEISNVLHDILPQLGLLAREAEKSSEKYAHFIHVLQEVYEKLESGSITVEADPAEFKNKIEQIATQYKIINSEFQKILDASEYLMLDYVPEVRIALDSSIPEQDAAIKQIKDYFKLLFPGVKMDDRLKKSGAELEIPAIDEKGGDMGGAKDSPPTMGTAPKDSDKPAPETPVASDDMTKIKEQLDAISKVLQETKFEQRLVDIKNEIMDEVSNVVRGLKTEFEQFKEKIIPERREFETEGAYRENLFRIACDVLDEVLPGLFEEIPDYSLIASQISRSFDDGTIADGIISISVMVARDGQRFDFKVDVPMLNGVALAPQFIQRGQKIIPLTKECIRTELESLSFRKIDIVDQTEKPNIFNNIGDNIYKKPTNQKEYRVTQPEPGPSGVPFNSKYKFQR